MNLFFVFFFHIIGVLKGKKNSSPSQKVWREYATYLDGVFDVKNTEFSSCHELEGWLGNLFQLKRFSRFLLDIYEQKQICEIIWKIERSTKIWRFKLMNMKCKLLVLISIIIRNIFTVKTYRYIPIQKFCFFSVY